MRQRVGGGLLGLLLLAGVTGGASAAPATSNATTTGALTALACDTTAFSGQVTRAGAPLTVRGTDGTERAISAGQGLVVVRNGANAGFGDLREGDQVNVVIPAGAAECSATRIEAASTAVAPARDRSGLWGLLGLLGLGGLAGLLRRPKPAVHTTERVVEYAPMERVETVEPVARIDARETRDAGASRR